jgi:hypothetical protein
LCAAAGEAQAKYNIIQPRLEDLQQVETGQAPALQGNLIVTAELAFQNAINVARFLLGAQLSVKVRLTFAAELGGFPVLTGGITTAFESTFGSEAPFPFQEQLLAIPPA